MKTTTLVLCTQGLIAMDIIALRSYAGQPIAWLWAGLAVMAGALMLALIKSDISSTK